MRVSKAETPAPGHVQVDLRRHRPNNRTELSPETGILIPYRVVKRLRVFTLQVDVATTPSELMESADMETIFALLTHKILRSVNNDGPAEAQLLLQDWCIFLCAHYNRHTFGQRRIDAADVDTTFCKCEPLLFLPEHVHALLQSPALAVPPESSLSSASSADGGARGVQAVEDARRRGAGQREYLKFQLTSMPPQTLL